MGVLEMIQGFLACILSFGSCSFCSLAAIGGCRTSRATTKAHARLKKHAANDGLGSMNKQT